MNNSKIGTPGVYINEQDAFPNSVTPVPTAVPAFVGYTPQAEYEGKSFTNTPKKISSFAEFQAIFTFPNPAPPLDAAKQYSPQYYLEAQKSQSEKGEYVQIDGTFYSILPDPNTIYYLYNSIRLFYENGGNDAYIVSVGGYGDPSGKPIETDDQIVNPNVHLNDLTKGIALLKNETEPTMYICPEATLLSVADNGTLMQEMLLQNEELGTVISIFDVIGGRNPDPIWYTKDIQTFRHNTGTNGLNYGTAYYPFVGTTILQNSDLDYTNLFGGDVKRILPLLSPSDQPNLIVESLIEQIINPPKAPLTTNQYNTALLNASTTYKKIMQNILHKANILPPSGGMAGVITITDAQNGPWTAPANTSIASVSSLPILLSESQQGGLNIDAVSGKSINAIRFFNGLGILVWGARTLDGNSQDWRYIPVRRTMIYLEQSCKLAAQAYVFSPNTKNTWEAVKSMIGSFLNNVWQQGGLLGATAADAFSVEAGLGTTMTSEDILTGYMNVTIKVAVTHPAEFIVLTFRQPMATSS